MKNNEHLLVDEIFNDCVDILRSGGSLQDCLNLYPQQAEELEPMLIMVINAQTTYQEINPLPQSKARIQFAVMNALNNEKKKSSSSNAFANFFKKPAAIFSSIFLVVLLAGGGAVTALAQKAMPEDNLYGIKKASENVALFFNFTKESKAKQSYKMAERRANELSYAIENNIEGQVIYDIFISFKTSYHKATVYSEGQVPAISNYENYNISLESVDFYRPIGSDLTAALDLINTCVDKPSYPPHFERYVAVADQLEFTLCQTDCDTVLSATQSTDATLQCNNSQIISDIEDLLSSGRALVASAAV